MVEESWRSKWMMGKARPVSLAALAMVIALAGLLGWARLGQTQQPERVCRDVNNITICGDEFFVEPTDEGEFVIEGNLEIGPKGKPAVVKVTDAQSTFNFQDLSPSEYRARFTHNNNINPTQGARNFMVGVVSFISDTTSSEPLFGTHHTVNPLNPNDSIPGVLFVDATAGIIRNPDAGEVPRFNQNFVDRNAAYIFPFLNRAMLQTLYKDGGTVGEFEGINVKIDLNTKKFTAVLPMNLRLTTNADENPTLQIKARVNIDHQGNFSGSVDGFAFQLAGIVMDASGVVLRRVQGTGTQFEPEFEAAKVEVKKNKNPLLPPLDPINQDLIFSFEKLKYKNGAFSLGGVTVPINNWQLGDAFKMQNQTLALVVDTATEGTDAESLFLELRSTLVFGSVATDASNLPVVMSISGKKNNQNKFRPIFEAGLQDVTPSLGAFKVQLKDVRFSGDPAANFFGIKADSAALQWPAHLGGKVATGVTGFKLGIDKDKKLVFDMGGGVIAVPEFQSGVLRGNLGGTFDLVQETVVFSLTGTLTVTIQGNSGVTTQAAITVRAGKNVQSVCPASSATCQLRYEKKLTGFGVKVAGFSLTLTNPRGLEDGGFAADTVGFGLPIGLLGSNGQQATGGQITGLSVAGNGNVSITGGGFELAPISIGGFQFVGMKGSFLKTTSGGYEFKASGKLPLPGLEPGSTSPGITASITIRTNAQGNFSGAGVGVTFTSVPGAGIPIGQTGMELTGIGGSFDLNNGTATIGVTMKANTLLRLPAPFNIPIATIDGGMSIQINPFLFSANAKLSVLIFQVASASIKIGDGQGFSGGKGMYVQFNIGVAIVQGQATLRVGRVIVNNEPKIRVAATASLKVVIKKRQFGTGRPPFDITLFSISFAGGRFKDNRESPPKETTGLLGSIKVGPFSASVFADMNANPPKVSLVNASKLVLINSAQVRALAAAKVEGYESRALTVAEAAEAGVIMSEAQAAGSEAIPHESVTFTSTAGSTLVVGVSYATGNPTLRLRLPGGFILTKDNVDNDNLDGSDVLPTDTRVLVRNTVTDSATIEYLYIIGNAAPGEYDLLIDNLLTFDTVYYLLNNAPEATITSQQCAGSAAAGVTASCANAATGEVVQMAQLPEGAPEDVTVGPGRLEVQWTAVDLDSPNDLVISVGYAPAPEAGGTVDFGQITLLDADLTGNAGNFNFVLTEVPTGKWVAVVVAEDGLNPPAIAFTDIVVTVLDKRAPAEPTGLTATSQAGELLIKWDQNNERDLAGYEIGFGVVDDGNPNNAASFVYTRTMGPKEVIAEGSNIVDAKLWGLNDNEAIYYGLRAYDYSGNYSKWTSPFPQATPWPISPTAWRPVPNSADGTPNGSIEIAFDTPLREQSLGGGPKLKVFKGTLHEDGTITYDDTPIQGTIEFLFDLEGEEILGLAFHAKNPLALGAPYKAVVVGGGSGIETEDGRKLPTDYPWTFFVGSGSVHLPLMHTR